jgi:hypothetical protein
MGNFQLIPESVRRKLNQLYREGKITKEQLMEKMRNGWFDSERKALRRRFEELMERYTKRNK